MTILTNGDLFFCGIKHSGKSRLGRIIASRLSCPWVDADDLILASLPSDSTVRSFYRSEGEHAFRKREYETMKRYLSATHPPCVVSMGGGASDNPDLLSLISLYGTSVYLSVPEDVLFRRIVKDGIPPFLEGEDPRGKFHLLFLHRSAIYGKECSLVVHLPDSPTVEMTADFLMEALRGAFDGTQQLWS